MSCGSAAVPEHCNPGSERGLTSSWCAAGDKEFRAPALVVATGGLSIPKIVCGTSFGYDLARRFGIRYRAHAAGACAAGVQRGGCPALLRSGRSFDRGDCGRATGQQLPGKDAGDASRAQRAGDPADFFLLEEEASPFSSTWRPTRKSLPALLEATAPRNSALHSRAALRKSLPNRLADRWLELHQPKSWTNAALSRIWSARFTSGLWHPVGTEGYGKAEVTAGGVDTDELSAKTMESRKVPGLFFIGEVVDVTGHLGGFNFQWAWASGASAGRAL